MKRILLLLVLVLSAGCHGKGANISFSNYHNHPAGSLRIVSYNINWGHDEDFKSDPIKTTDAIEKSKAEVLILQESTPQWEKVFRKRFGQLYPYQDYEHTKNGGGKAILSKFPIIKKGRIPSAFGWYPVQADLIQVPSGVVQIVNVHLTPTFVPHPIPGMKKVTSFAAPNQRLQEIYHFLNYLKKNVPTIIAGDFNESDKGFALRYLSQHGFQDAILRNKSFFTWHHQFGPIVVRRRLDHVFYSPTLEPFRVQTLFEGGSDHYPLVVDFKRP
jgi:endonuclease/exonuclease/phosphatase family metal-dependent hydrolase